MTLRREEKKHRDHMFKFLEATATMVALIFMVIFQCKYIEIGDQNKVFSSQYIHMNPFWKLC